MLPLRRGGVMVSVRGHVSLINKPELWDRGFHRNLCFQVAWETPIFKLRRKVTGLGMWLSWRNVTSGLPDDFTNLGMTSWSICLGSTWFSCRRHMIWHRKVIINPPSAVRSGISPKLIFASCVGYFYGPTVKCQLSCWNHSQYYSFGCALTSPIFLYNTTTHRCHLATSNHSRWEKEQTSSKTCHLRPGFPR